jgi:hypothetical protein
MLSNTSLPGPCCLPRCSSRRRVPHRPLGALLAVILNHNPETTHMLPKKIIDYWDTRHFVKVPVICGGLHVIRDTRHFVYFATISTKADKAEKSSWNRPIMPIFLIIIADSHWQNEQSSRWSLYLGKLLVLRQIR